MSRCCTLYLTLELHQWCSNFAIAAFVYRECFLTSWLSDIECTDCCLQHLVPLFVTALFNSGHTSHLANSLQSTLFFQMWQHNSLSCYVHWSRHLQLSISSFAISEFILHFLFFVDLFKREGGRRKFSLRFTACHCDRWTSLPAHDSDPYCNDDVL